MQKHHLLSAEDKLKERTEYIQLSFPKLFSISLGKWPCNRKCLMCPMYSMDVSKPEFMTREVFERACDCVGDRSGISVDMTAYGEPFQHPLADEFLFTMRKRCPNAHLLCVTNGSMLDDERCRKIIDSGIDNLAISLNAGSRESYQWLTGTDEYDKVCRSIERLMELKAQKGANHLFVQTHIMGIKELQEEFKSFLERWKGITDKVYVRNYGNWAGMTDEHNITGIAVDRYGNVKEEDTELPKRYPCGWPWYATTVQANGDVLKCFVEEAGDGVPVGNIMQTSFEEIWQGAALNRCRKMLQENRPEELPYCEKCIIWSLFPHFWEEDENGFWK